MDQSVSLKEFLTLLHALFMLGLDALGFQRIRNREILRKKIRQSLSEGLQGGQSFHIINSRNDVSLEWFNFAYNERHTRFVSSECSLILNDDI